MWEEHKVSRELCKAGRILAESRMVHSNLGTISAVVDREKDLYLTKPGTLYYRYAVPEDFALLTLEGKLLQSKNPPSMNWLVHAECYRRRPDIGAIVHAHPRHVNILLSQIPRRSLYLLTSEAVWFAKPVVEYIKNFSVPWELPDVSDLDPEPLAQAVGEKIVTANIVGIRNHGVIAVGRDIHEALAAAEVIEEEAAIIVGIYAMGKEPAFRTGGEICHDLSGMPPWFSRPFDPKKVYPS